MIGYFAKRKLKKQLKEYLHMARHARHMREDIADPADLAALIEAEAVVLEIQKTGKGDVERAVQTLEEAANRVYPFARKTPMMEWTETLIVALGAAMAIRAFFFQPFKIPTGSMQPTLNGITVEQQAEPGLFDNPLTKFPKWLITGTSYKEIRAKASGRFMQRNVRGDRDKIIITIGGKEHKFPSYLQEELRRQIAERSAQQRTSEPYYNEGDVIVAAKVIAGDHILVNKMKYNWMKPERGDISVFSTRHLDHPQIRKDNFYIKRMVGLPGEKIQIQNHRLVADGEVVSEPPMFETIATDPKYSGGHSTTPGSRLETADDFIQLGEDEYLMMGDNTKPNMSLDGRFFGGVPRNDFQGPAIFVYWPFRDHWGVVR
ncbi:signal peptidase I [Pontiella agarivorans]|uniref:Signal peptidase I n=1 Tax=Pontiella agarivorans TaxID=3038953 RepID=A0ABU5MYY7_9BACT|nr:signal peptidase I [Pontiella agarivorans]MDZ8119404.1 signal peptidase I [Pontiella agarivorans]